MNSWLRSNGLLAFGALITFTGIGVFLITGNTLIALILLVLLPLAMTMALIWKTKEVILESVFGATPPPASGN